MSVRIDEDFSHNEEHKSWSKDVKKKVLGGMLLWNIH